MKLTKVFQGNQYITKFKVDGKKYTRMEKFYLWRNRNLLRLAKICIIAWMIVGGFVIGQANPNKISYAYSTITEYVESKSPVMDRIASCESSSLHMGKKGQITVKVNTNGTYDLGKFQINSIWNAQATKLGYDLTKEKDNEAFAMWLYKNQGTGPWSSSAKCWNK